jgi:predicted DNA-binding transcriptional regulator AlpA
MEQTAQTANVPRETPDDYLIGKPEVARMLDTSTRSVDRFVAEGALPVVAVSPRRVAFVKADVKALIAARRKRRGNPAAAESRPALDARGVKYVDSGAQSDHA